MIMPRNINIRLIPLSTVYVSGIFVALLFAVSGYAFFAYINSINAQSKHLLYAISAMPSYTHRNSAMLATSTAQKDFNPTLLVTFISDRKRITVLEHANGSRESQPFIILRDRDNRSGEPQAHGIFARLALGTATIAGLQVYRDDIGDTDIYAKVNDPVFVASIAACLPAFGIIFLLGLIISYILGNRLSRQALQPLDEVTLALKALSIGDFRPRTIFASSKGTLAGLASAYNAASVSVQNALSERDQANLTMRKFASDAGHQLKTPLTIVRGRLGIVSAAPDEKIMQHEKSIAVMDGQCALMAELIDNLMLLDRWEQETQHIIPTPIDVLSLLSDIITIFCETYQQRSFTFDNMVGEQVLALIDPQEFTFMLSNIIDNALKYTDGSVMIALSYHETTLLITIQDQGPGMPETINHRVFDRFFRGTRRDIDGSGLGLPIARAAAERANGTITLESSIKHGTLVQIRLPVAMKSPL